MRAMDSEDIDDVDDKAPSQPVTHTTSASGHTRPANMFKTKILILGPVKAGKTTIANYLADAVENFIGDYRPTHGLCVL